MKHSSKIKSIKSKHVYKHTSEKWIVMPSYNEHKNISRIIDEVHKYCRNIVVVDDGSLDSTYEIAKRKNKYTLRHIINLGKGAAMKTGCEFAIKQGAKKIVFIDSDGQHEPKELPLFFKSLDDYDIVFGSRRLDKNMPSILRFGNYVLSSMISFLFGIKLADTQSGYRGMTAEAYKRIRWRANDYSVETEMIANAGKNHLKYKEIKINTVYNDRYKGTTVIDGIKIGLKILVFKIRRLI
jgi:glycosyltransferase involved in cell wall biosynthesis